ncbi:hypothetical protein [Capnocytophaga periodontitidis]|uniref:hypothetical protein n=2 Tax=Capnocytophaga TaxID=1016 RepID=UPI0018E0C65B|nr:hypothetical protein [Capnocytophaga periodontitidis]MBI1669054.1 hypothetical protein [Capnocytophaga periodontitidis]
MRGLQLTKMYKIFFLFICIITLSCNTNSNHTSNLKTITLENNHQTITNENNEQKIENEELLLFLDNLKKALFEKQIDEIANNMINYPLEDEGPLYEMIYGDKVYEEGFTTKDKPIGKEDFIKIFDKLFTKKYILLFQKLDTKNIIENRIFSWWNKEKTTNIDFSFLSENSFQIDISFLEDDVIGGYTIKYIFKKINGKILLYLVRSV